MAVHNGFDNRLYVNVWERKQDHLWPFQAKFGDIWSYFNPFLLCPAIFYLVAALFIQRRTG